MGNPSGICRQHGGPRTATILSGQTTSTAVDMRGYAGGVFQMPAAFTGTTIKFRGSLDTGDTAPADGTFDYLKDAAGEHVTRTVAVDSGGIHSLPSAESFGVNWLKFVSSASEGADRTIKVGACG